MKPKISVIICALNEEHNLRYVLPHIPDWVNEVLLIDGGSTDKTVEVAQQLCPNIRIVHQWRRGKGNALMLGIFLATNDIIVTLDANGGTNPNEMMHFIKPLLNGYDFVKGTRFAFGFSKHKKRHRVFGNWIILKTFNILFHKKYTDLCSGYNAFWRKRVIETLSPWSKDGYENEPFINSRIAKRGLRVIEVPHTDSPRLYGTLKEHSWRQGLKAIKSIVREGFYE